MDDQSSDQANQPGAESGPQSSAAGSAWKDVGEQFEALGVSLGNAFKAAWNDQETRGHLQEMKTGLESMVQHLDKAIQETRNSETGEHIRSEAEKFATNLHSAGEQTYQEVRPQLANALRQVNQELQKLADRMEPPSQR